MAPRIQAKDLETQELKIKYEFAEDAKTLFPEAPSAIDEYAKQIQPMMEKTVANLFLVPEDQPFRRTLENCLYNIRPREHPMFSSTPDDAFPAKRQTLGVIKGSENDGYARREWQILPDLFSEISRCLNQIDRSIGYKVHRTHRRDFRVPIGRCSFQRTDCGQYLEVIKGGFLKPFTRWPIKATFYTTHLEPASAEDYLAGEILSLVAQVAFNYENDPESVAGDQKCFCLTLHGQYVHFSHTVIPEEYIRYHNSGKPLKQLEEVKVIFSPEYNLTKAEDRYKMIWGESRMNVMYVFYKAGYIDENACAEIQDRLQYLYLSDGSYFESSVDRGTFPGLDDDDGMGVLPIEFCLG
ncbi:hypothetical protein Dda_4378 [Drechslerella dactyloides]|uniref:Uncharacterized protein n=1 Tax=Drechslerella dactyloides TaxID=74499 RepID=A0AAD6NJ79_DREDA|nr:hypothetical protein Dda_4378 [Drechslerella dactyloides]